MEVVLALLALDLLVKPLLLHLIAPAVCPWSMVLQAWGAVGGFALLVLAVCALYGRSLALWPRRPAARSVRPSRSQENLRPCPCHVSDKMP